MMRRSNRNLQRKEKNDYKNKNASKSWKDRKKKKQDAKMLRKLSESGKRKKQKENCKKSRD